MVSIQRNNSSVPIKKSIMDNFMLEQKLRKEVEKRKQENEGLKIALEKIVKGLKEQIHECQEELEILQTKISNAKKQLGEYE